MTKYRSLIDHYRSVLGLNQKLKPVDINRVSMLITNLNIKDKESKALFTVAYYHIKVHTRFTHEKAQTIAYTLTEGVRMLGEGKSKEDVYLEMIAIPNKFFEEEQTVVNLADVALDYLERMISNVEEAIKEQVTA
ncbi:hypothetical protein FDJ25_gp125 [Vibrio phage Aphrodite1]|uniref:Uncharacterized protein n=1 Tax=Vibrio phage Aphrodite1 TaxID=2070057 RepID=A0A2I7QI50_9CAUD|nr:hypothetical protein FDJ25_gp125 [Vibrio phage Aphrodite1]AUR81069.1 hypothetical protein Aphrodite1_0077 [Vibrio phage Aphrodite1]